MMIFASLRVYEPTASWDHEQGAFRFAAVSVSVDLGSDQLRDKMKPHGVEGGDRVDSDHSTNTDEVIKLTKSVPVLGKLAKDVPGSARSLLNYYYSCGLFAIIPVKRVQEQMVSTNRIVNAKRVSS